MKKIFVFLLTITISFILVSCNKTTDNNDSSNTDKNSQNSEQVWLVESMFDHYENCKSSYFYDEYGNQIKTIKEDSVGNIKATWYYEYDENNNLTKRSVDPGNGELKVQLIQTYDEIGRLIEKRELVTGGDRVSAYKYDEQNRIIEVSNEYGEIKETYTYDEYGNYEVHSVEFSDQYTVYFADGTMSERYLNSERKYTYSYNAHGHLTECTLYSGDEVIEKMVYSLDEHGNAVRVTQINVAGVETVMGEYTYKLYTIKTK